MGHFVLMYSSYTLSMNINNKQSTCWNSAGKAAFKTLLSDTIKCIVAVECCSLAWKHNQASKKGQQPFQL